MASVAAIAACAALVAGLVGWSLGAGAWRGDSAEREVLYWVDPMNPSFRSPEPGTAPCGMPLEPVYTDGGPPGASTSDPPGMVLVPATRRQLVGVVSEAAGVGPVEGTLLLPGKVAVDESRVHIVAPKVVSRVSAIGVATTGSLVREGEFLVTLGGDNASTTQWVMLDSLKELDQVRRDDPGNTQEIMRLEASIRASEQTLFAYGMSRRAVNEIKRKRQPVSAVELHSPVSGYVLSRSAVLGEEYHAFTTMFVIADIRRIFVLVDVFSEDIDLVRPGTPARVRVPGRTSELDATVSSAPLQFDPTFNGVKLRLEVDNPDSALLPEMIVDVDLRVTTPESISVSSSAVLDSGAGERVYLDLGEGRYVPRDVRSGWSLGGRTQILEGLTGEERVVVSGGFLLDSESRMRASGGDPSPNVVLDPVCGMAVDADAATEAGLSSEHAGTTHSFCNPACKERFDTNPQEFLSVNAAP
ncbi:MAG: YHS domain-containing protein [bacterium]|nr:YHS domain-containing protein [bacterium]